MRFRQRNTFYSFIMSKVVNELISKSEKGKMKVTKAQSGNSSFVVGYYGEWKPQSIYVPVCPWSFVPPKSCSIWTNLKNKANVNLGKIGVSSFITSEYERFWGVLCFFAAKNKPNFLAACTVSGF